MIQRFGVLINPTAGHGRGRRGGEQVLEELRARGTKVVDLSHTDPVAAYEAAIARRGSYDALIVVGGDGMAHVGINLTAGTMIPLGLVAVGSGNDLARHLGLPVHKVSDGIDVILAAAERGPLAMDALRLTPAVGQEWPHSFIPSKHRWAGCVVSAGFDSMVNARANTYKWPLGMGRYIRAVFRELQTFAPYPYAVTVDGEHTEFYGTLIALANAPSFGGGMRIAPAARANSGKIEVVMATEVTKGQLLRVFPRVYRGTHLAHPAVSVRSASSITIGPQTGGAIPKVFADGELVGEAPVTIEVVPGAVQMLCPTLEA